MEREVHKPATVCVSSVIRKLMMNTKEMGLDIAV